MALYTETDQVAHGISHSINRAILNLTTTTAPERGQFCPIHALLNGYPKALIVHWRGPMQDAAIGRDWDPNRGDGDVEIVGPDSPLYRIPHNVPRNLNIWAGIPLWLLGHHPNGRLQPLACGLLHPLMNSANLDFFHTETGDHLARSYYCDPRVDWPGAEPMQETVDERCEREVLQLAEMGAALVDFYAVQDKPHWRERFL